MANVIYNNLSIVMLKEVALLQASSHYSIKSVIISFNCKASLKGKILLANLQRQKNRLDYIICKIFKRKCKLNVFNKHKNFLIFIKVFNFLGGRPKFTHTLIHFCMFFLDFLGHVIHFCKFLCATLIYINVGQFSRFF